MSDDLLSFLTSEDREWLGKHGWVSQDEAIVKLPVLKCAIRVVRLRVPDEIEAYQRDYNHPPFTLLSHAIRNSERQRLFTSTSHAAKTLGRLSLADVLRLASAAAALNGQT